MTRIVVAGAELEGFDFGLPAASVRLLLPKNGGRLERPTWRGNEFLLADDSRPVLRTLTPLQYGLAPLELALEIVRHGTRLNYHRTLERRRSG